MSDSVSRRILWLAIVANLLIITLALAAGTALAQGKPDGEQVASGAKPQAPNAPYNLQGDTTNVGSASTVISNTAVFTQLWFVLDLQVRDLMNGAALRASGGSIGVAAIGSSVAVSGTSNNGFAFFGHSDNGSAIYGHSSGSDSNDYAVTGVCSNCPGLYGKSDNSYAVIGSSLNFDSIYGYTYGQVKAALLGYNANPSGAGYGVRASVISTNTGSYGGHFSAAAGIGLFGKSNSNIGVRGESVSNYGLYGKSTSGIGLYGFSSSNIGLYGQTATGNYALYAVNPSKAANKYAGWFEGNVRINGSYVATGTKSALVYTNQGERLMYAEESTMNRFSDEGTATLKDGRAVIKIDPLFAQTVILDEGYHVFLTPRSHETAGLAVINETATSFEVRELNKGKGSFSFHWRISALRKGYEKQRMEPAPAAVPPADLPQGELPDK